GRIVDGVARAEERGELAVATNVGERRRDGDARGERAVVARAEHPFVGPRLRVVAGDLSGVAREARIHLAVPIDVDRRGAGVPVVPRDGPLVVPVAIEGELARVAV